MLARSLVLILLSVLPPGQATFAAEPAGIAGVWEGRLVLGDSGLRLVFNLTADAKGSLTGKMDSPDQGAFGIALDSVTFEKDVLRCEVKRISGVYEGKLEAATRTIVGQWQQGGRSFALTLRPGVASQLSRPQEPKPPYPYIEEEASYRAAADVTLAGTLTKPKGKGPFAAVLLITGSGPQDRNEELMGHKPFLVLADDLTKRGIAVLRVDDRGVGASTGSRDGATSEDFAADALAGVAYLRKRSDIDGRRIGLIGHSEGAMVAALAAVKSKDVAFIAMLAGPGVKGSELLLLQASVISEIAGVPAGMRAFNRETQQRMFAVVQEEKTSQAARARLAAVWEQRKQDAAASSQLGEDEKRMIASGDATFQSQLEILTSPWMRHFLSYDPAATLRRVRVPVLAINGSLDLQVPVRQNLPAIEAALKAGGNTNVKVVELRDLNHLFQKATTGSPAEYGTIEQTMDPQALQTIGEWVVTQSASTDR
jgi:pimeloyl-ACP methyl ester carboxylesterase